MLLILVLLLVVVRMLITTAVLVNVANGTWSSRAIMRRRGWQAVEGLMWVFGIGGLVTLWLVLNILRLLSWLSLTLSHLIDLGYLLLLLLHSLHSRILVCRNKRRVLVYWSKSGMLIGGIKSLSWNRHRYCFVDHLILRVLL